MGALQFAGFAVVLGHAVLDGHLVREATTFSLLFLLSIHKFMDGADARILSLDRTWDAWIARAALVIATPLGFFFVPVSVSGGLLDASLFATVIGLNLGSAFHLFKHALVAHHDHSPAVS